jgi:prepilin-type N-terminal cleavage/methylation domain-containing protein
MRAATRPVLRRRGFTLIEVLVAMLVLAVGLMGLLSMRLATVKHGANSHARALASLHAADIFERMRANPVRAAGGSYTLAIDDAPPRRRQQQRPRGLDHAGGVRIDATGMVEVEVRWTERDNTAESGRLLAFTFRSQL